MTVNKEMFKMGYFIQYAGSEGDFTQKEIMKAQLRMGHDPLDASFTHIEVSGGDWDAVAINPPKAKCIDIRVVHGGRRFRLYKYKGYDKDPMDRNRLKVAYFSATLCNLAYDWFGVVKFKLPFIFHIKNQFFCSEGAAWSLQKVYPEAFGMEPHQIMPADFSSAEFELVGEGVVPELAKEVKSRIKLSLVGRTPFNTKVRGFKFTFPF